MGDPARVNDIRSKGRYTVLQAAVICYQPQESFTRPVVAGREGRGPEFGSQGQRRCSLWLYGAFFRHPRCVAALYDANPAPPTPFEEPLNLGMTILMNYAFYGDVKCVARLIEDPRARATVNAQNSSGTTALHKACSSSPEKNTVVTVRLLLQAGADPFVVN